MLVKSKQKENTLMKNGAAKLTDRESFSGKMGGCEQMKYASSDKTWFLQFSMLLGQIDGHRLDLVGEARETKSSVG